jgi:two-component system nitrogen regulation response regulator GlnG
LPTCLPDGIRGVTPARLPDAAYLSAGMIDVAGMVKHLADSGHEDIYREVHNVVDRIVLEELLRRVVGNQVAASRLLGISRTTLRNKLESLGLEAHEEQPPEKAK